MDPALKELTTKLKGKILILGMGNSLKGDDGAGSILAQRLTKRIRTVVLDAGIVPENYLEKIVRESPDSILVVDCVDFGGSPGDWQFFDYKKLITKNSLSTHNPPFHLFFNYLRYQTKAKILFLGIQPNRIKFGDDLSREVEGSLQDLEDFLIRWERQTK